MRQPYTNSLKKQGVPGSRTALRVFATLRACHDFCAPSSFSRLFPPDLWPYALWDATLIPPTSGPQPGLMRACGPPTDLPTGHYGLKLLVAWPVGITASRIPSSGFFRQAVGGTRRRPAAQPACPNARANAAVGRRSKRQAA